MKNNYSIFGNIDRRSPVQQEQQVHQERHSRVQQEQLEKREAQITVNQEQLWNEEQAVLCTYRTGENFHSKRREMEQSKTAFYSIPKSARSQGMEEQQKNIANKMQV
jgi:hypothetical protein